VEAVRLLEADSAVVGLHAVDCSAIPWTSSLCETIIRWCTSDQVWVISRVMPRLNDSTKMKMIRRYQIAYRSVFVADGPSVEHADPCELGHWFHGDGAQYAMKTTMIKAGTDQRRLSAACSRIVRCGCSGSWRRYLTTPDATSNDGCDRKRLTITIDRRMINNPHLFINKWARLVNTSQLTRTWPAKPHYVQSAKSINERELQTVRRPP